MDKNQAIGLVLISALLIIYFYFLSPKSEIPQPTEVPPPSIEKKAQENSLEPEELDSAELTNYDSPISFTHLEEKIYLLENKDLTLKISSKGAILTEVYLKDYLTYDSKTLYLIQDGSSRFKQIIETHKGKIDLNKIHYESTGIKTLNGDTLSLEFFTEIDDEKKVRHTFTLPPKGFKISYAISLNGFEDDLIKNELAYSWDNNIIPGEEDLEQSRQKTTINFYTASENFDNLSAQSEGEESETLYESIKWAAVKQKFFTSAIITGEEFSHGAFKTDYNKNDSTYVKKAKINLTLATERLNEEGLQMYYFFGPNNYQILKKVTKGFSENIYLGWAFFAWFNKFLIIPIFNFLENYTSNYGLIIIMLVLIIKILLSPLSYRSYVSMAKTKVLKPEIDELKQKYGDDTRKIQSEQMKLFQKVGVNPLSGCVPILLQMPILFAMFNFFPNSIELRQESFLWAHDLSTYDVIFSWDAYIPLLSSFYGNHISLFTLLMTASTILYTWSNNQISSAQGPMQTVSYVMPVVFMFVLNSFPAGLSFYYFVSNLVTFAQQALIRRFVDEGKIRRILDENKKNFKNKKKSKFQQRLEDAIKAGQQTQKNRGK